MSTTDLVSSGVRAANRRPAPGDISSPPRASRDAGFTFVEIVVTIVLVGIVVVPVLAAVRSSIRAASLTGEAAEVETLLVNAIDRVSRADRGNFSCDFRSLVDAAVETHGWPTSTAVVTQKYLDSAGTWVQGPGNTACPGTGFQNGMVQLIHIRIISPNTRIVRELEVVKGDV